MINKRYIYLLLVAVSLLMAFITPEKKISVYLVGDSTMSIKQAKAYPETGWGMPFVNFFDERVMIKNHAQNGRSTGTFITEKRWSAVMDSLKEGDYVFIQFGHNDESKEKKSYTTEADFKSNLLKFVREARSRKAIPVLLTPVARRRFDTSGKVVESHAIYAPLVISIAKKHQVPLIDLNEKSMSLYQKFGEQKSKLLFNQLQPGENPNYPEGKNDNTHFNELGAREIAQLVLQEIKNLRLGLANYIVKPKSHFTVAKDGSGDFTTLQEAINAVPDFRKTTTVIYIKNGIYKEKINLSASKKLVKLVGESVENTILSYDDFATRKNRFGEEMGTSGSASFYMYADDFTAEHITFENSAGPVGQAVALWVAGDRAKFYNCRMLGFQDTLYTFGANSRQYYSNCYIEGTVDFIFGSATAVFDGSVIFCKKGGRYITASSAPDTVKYGYVFLNSTIKGDAADQSFFLGRPWRPYAKSVFINCYLGKVIKAEGWDNWSKESNEKTAYYAEYKNDGPGFMPKHRVSWSVQLTAEEVKEYTLTKIFKGWDVKAN
ncbi:pectinesterase family protein [Pedobacter immunditicola]|uniref:pectinesterase family protein n=1 Tax=Pedobacter immunditicola TaxID=3133440 RepID=UPI0030A0903C